MRCCECKRNLERVPYDKNYALECPNHHCIVYLDDDNNVTEYNCSISYDNNIYLVFSYENRINISILKGKSYKKLLESNKYIKFNLINNIIDLSPALKLLNLKAFL